MLLDKITPNSDLNQTTNSKYKDIIRYSLFLILIISSAVIVSILYLDLPVANYFKQEELSTIYYYSREITNIGYSIHYFILALLGLIFSKLLYPNVKYLNQKVSSKNIYHIYQWSLFSIKCLLFIGIILNILKALIGRQRPHASADFYNLNFDILTTESHWHSFPSGHAQVLFTVATLALLFWPKYRHLFLVIAGFLSLTRVTIHQHFLSDIIAGGFIGHLGTLWLYYLWPPKTPSSLTTSLNLTKEPQ